MLRGIISCCCAGFCLQARSQTVLDRPKVIATLNPENSLPPPLSLPLRCLSVCTCMSVFLSCCMSVFSQEEDQERLAKIAVMNCSTPLVLIHLHGGVIQVCPRKKMTKR